jgi:Ras-related protein Rab-1A
VLQQSDDAPNEEKDMFVALLYKFMDDCGTPLNKAPTILGRDLDLFRLFRIVKDLGGYNRVCIGWLGNVVRITIVAI